MSDMSEFGNIDLDAILMEFVDGEKVAEMKTVKETEISSPP